MNHSFFNKIESKTGVPMDEVFALANAIQHANFQDEQQVRKIIQKVGVLANKPVTKEVEDQLVHSIVRSGKPVQLSDIEEML